MDFRLRTTFWGVRGSTPTPQIDTLSYGGNTACLEVSLASGEMFIFDAGTGIRRLGESLIERFPNQKLELKVFLTHFHWDHIQGIPFFGPLCGEKNEITFYSVHFPGVKGRRYGAKSPLEETLKLQMANPYFPIGLDLLPARKTFAEIDPEPLKFGKLTIHPFQLNHPGRAFGYRIEYEGAVIVYATDLEHGHEELDKVVRDFSQNADLLIFDAHFAPEDFKGHEGWGHSTWLEGCNVAKDAGVKRLALFHHNPAYNDDKLFWNVQRARREFDNTMAAEEGWSLEL